MSTKVFPWKETEARHVAEGSDSLAFIHGAMGLGAVFHDLEIVLLCQCQDRIHVCRLSVEVHRDNGFCPRRELRRDLRRIDVISFRVDVHKDDPGSGMSDGF